MSEQADDITSYTSDRKSILDYIFIVGSWLVSCISLVVIGLIAYWAIKIPEKNINNLPIINAMQGEIRIEPDEPGGKSFHDEGLSIYKNLENGSKILDKNDIMLNKADQNSVNLRTEIKSSELTKDDQKDLTIAIEEALKEVVNGNIQVKDKSVAKSQLGFLKLYLGSFGSLSKAEEFKQFIKKRNNNLLNNDNLKIFEQLEGEKKSFRVELMNISSIEEGKKLCSMLSSKQFSCLLVNEQGVN